MGTKINIHIVNWSLVVKYKIHIRWRHCLISVETKNKGTQVHTNPPYQVIELLLIWRSLITVERMLSSFFTSNLAPKSMCLNYIVTTSNYFITLNVNHILLQTRNRHTVLLPVFKRKKISGPYNYWEDSLSGVHPWDCSKTVQS